MCICTSAHDACGENLTRTQNDVVLTLSGTGEMTNDSYKNHAPWYAECAYILTVTIEDGVTAIGNYALTDCSSLTSINMPNNISSIGWCAFSHYSSLTNIRIPNSVTFIGSAAFENCSLRDTYYTGTQEQWEAIDCRDETIAKLPPESIHHNATRLSCTVSIEEETAYLPDGKLQIPLLVDIASLFADKIAVQSQKAAKNVIVNITLPEGHSFSPETDIRTRGYASPPSRTREISKKPSIGAACHPVFH